MSGPDADRGDGGDAIRRDHREEDPAPARVWLFQPEVQHYRIPIWDRLVERGSGLYELTVIGPLKDGEAWGGGFREYFREGLARHHRFPILLFTWPGAVRAVLREKPDVVMMGGNPRNITCWRLPGAARRVGAAVVAWSKIHSYSGVPDWIMIPIKRRFYRAMDRIVCYGRSSATELTAIGYPSDRIRIAQNTIDTTRIFEHGDVIRQRAMELRKETGLTDRPILLSIGRMDPDKRHADLLEAWPRLRESNPELAMVLVGSGPSIDELRRRAESIDADRVILTGRVPEGDDYAWLAAADVAVFPGAVGLAINQALALGCPTVIADERGADSEIVLDGETGWRYPKGSVDRLVLAVEHVLSDPEASENVVECGRRLMRDEVTVDRMVDQLHETILDAVAISSTRRAPR